jgi:hypothetical protein
MDAVVIWSGPLENRPPNRVASELQPVATLASNAAANIFATDFPILGELLIRMTRSTLTPTAESGSIRLKITLCKAPLPSWENHALMEMIKAR